MTPRQRRSKIIEKSHAIAGTPRKPGLVLAARVRGGSQSRGPGFLPEAPSEPWLGLATHAFATFDLAAAMGHRPSAAERHACMAMGCWCRNMVIAGTAVPLGIQAASPAAFRQGMGSKAHPAASVAIAGTAALVGSVLVVSLVLCVHDDVCPRGRRRMPRLREGKRRRLHRRRSRLWRQARGQRKPSLW